MKTKLLYAGAAAALLLTGAARAEDPQQPQGQPPLNDAARAAMHEAMQHQMATPAPGAQLPAELPGMPDRASGTAMRARQHAGQQAQQQTRQQTREAARERAMKRGAQDAAMARGGATHGDATRTMNHPGSGGMMGEATGQQGAGMMRTGDVHGGSGGMMPSGGGMMGGQTGGSGGMTGGSGPGTGTPMTSPTAPTGGGTMMGK